MSAECFLDTNVLVYAAAGRGPEEAKRRRALELIQTEDVCLSAQVLQEFEDLADGQKYGRVQVRNPFRGG